MAPLDIYLEQIYFRNAQLLDQLGQGNGRNLDLPSIAPLPNLTVMNVAMAGQTGTLPFYLSDRNDEASSILVGHEGSAVVRSRAAIVIFSTSRFSYSRNLRN